MINYRNLLESLPAKTVVFAFGRFSPPTIGHELLLKVIKKVASSNKADHIVYVSRTVDKKKNPLPVDRKLHYLKLMFPNINFIAANDQQRSFLEAAKELNKKYNNIIMIAGSDRVQEFNTLLNKYNGKNFQFDSIQVISAGERDPDSDDASGMSATKMRAAAAKGDYSTFKRGVPQSMREIDAKLMMNEIRHGMGLDTVKEQIKFTIDELREKYFKEEIFLVGDIISSNNQKFEIISRGTNYITVVNESGEISKKWIQDCEIIDHINESIVEETSLVFKGYNPKNILLDEAIEALLGTIERHGQQDPMSVLMAIKATDTYMDFDADPELVKEAHEKAKESLNRLNEFSYHKEYWNTFKITNEEEMNEELSTKTIKQSDALKVARIIASFLGLDTAEQMSNPAQIINSALRKVKSKTLNKDSIEMLKRMLTLANEVHIEYDTNLVPHTIKEGLEKACWKGYEAIGTKEKNGRTVPNCVPVKEDDTKNKIDSRVTIDKNSTYNAAKDVLRYSDFQKLLKMNKGDIKEQHNLKATNVPAAEIADETLENQDDEHTKPGHTMNVDSDDNLRRRKIAYRSEEKDIEVKKQYKPKEDKLPAETQSKKFDAFFGEETEETDHLDNVSETELNKLADTVNDIDDIIDAYNDHELAIIDDTGEEVEEDLKEESQVIMEVLSRMERIKAKIRFAKTKAKRERKVMLALKRHSDSSTINKRARRLAINLLKKRIAKKDLSKLSIGEKERLEKIVERSKTTINRLAMKLAPKVRNIEANRLSHHGYTKKP